MSTSEEKPTEPTPAPSPINYGAWAGLITSALGALGSIASGGWGGLATMAFLAIGGTIGITMLINFLNKKIDKRDMNAIGGFSGKEGADLRDQVRDNQAILDRLQQKDQEPRT